MTRWWTGPESLSSTSPTTMAGPLASLRLPSYSKRWQSEINEGVNFYVCGMIWVWHVRYHISHISGQNVYTYLNPSLCHTLLSLVPDCFSFSLLVSGGRGDVSLSVHETVRRGRDVPPTSCSLPPPPVWKQRLQWPVSSPRILLASTKAGLQHLWSFQRHFHPAQPGAPSAAKEQPPDRRSGQSTIFCRKLPDAPAVGRLPIHAHPAPVTLLTSAGPGSSYGHASVACSTSSLSCTYAHERLPLLGRGSIFCRG